MDTQVITKIQKSILQTSLCLLSVRLNSQCHQRLALSLGVLGILLLNSFSILAIWENGCLHNCSQAKTQLQSNRWTVPSFYLGLAAFYIRSELNKLNSSKNIFFLPQYQRPFKSSLSSSIRLLDNNNKVKTIFK